MRLLRKATTGSAIALALLAPLGVSATRSQTPLNMAALGRQLPPLVVRVVDDVSRRPLTNAEVLNLASGENRFTDERGEARLSWPSGGKLDLRVRQIGYKYVERLLQQQSAGMQRADTAVFELHAVAYALPAVATTATRHCGPEDDSTKALSAIVLEQLRSGAERYGAFRRAYPFRVRIERRTARRDVDGKLKLVRVADEETDAERWGDPYVAGKILQYGPGGGLSVPILFLSSLADPVFWTHHCFAAHGVESLAGARVIHMDFAPTPDVKAPDWAGTAFVDSASSLLRLVQFHLSGLGDEDLPRRLDGYTTFMSPTPSIVVPDSTVAMWWRRGPEADDQWGTPDVLQLIHLRKLVYRKRTPAM